MCFLRHIAREDARLHYLGGELRSEVLSSRYDQSRSQSLILLTRLILWWPLAVSVATIKIPELVDKIRQDPSRQLKLVVTEHSKHFLPSLGKDVHCTVTLFLCLITGTQLSYLLSPFQSWKFSVCYGRPNCLLWSAVSFPLWCILQGYFCEFFLLIIFSSICRAMAWQLDIKIWGWAVLLILIRLDLKLFAHEDLDPNYVFCPPKIAFKA
jgi:hypothetical protein